MLMGKRVCGRSLLSKIGRRQVSHCSFSLCDFCNSACQLLTTDSASWSEGNAGVEGETVVLQRCVFLGVAQLHLPSSFYM